MRWRRIGCFGCLIVSIVGILVALIFFDTLKDLIAEEFSESNIVPNTISANGLSSPGTGVIKDLAYIEVLAIGYSDDADPEYEGVSIDISFYDSESDAISFSAVPININIELFGYKDPLSMFEIDSADIVYSGSLSIDHSMRLGEMFGNYIRVPFSEIPISTDLYEPFGSLRIVVITPQQGEYERTYDIVPIYRSE